MDCAQAPGDRARPGGLGWSGAEVPTMKPLVVPEKCFRLWPYPCAGAMLLAFGGFAQGAFAQCEEAALHAPGGALNTGFGRSVAVSSDGTTGVVGAWLDDVQGTDSGATYVFALNGGRWEYQATLLADDGVAGDEFGLSVAISATGDVAVIGAPFDDGSAMDTGSAYVFRRRGKIWNQEVKLTSDDAALADNHGYAVAVSGDGTTLLVGVRRDDDACPANPDCQSGSADVYGWDGAAWGHQVKLTASDAAAGDYFGSAVALSADGQVALVGISNLATTPGAAYVFVRETLGWSEQAKLTPVGGMPADLFGRAVALSPEGDVALIGQKGSAHAFVRDGSTWSTGVEMMAWDAQPGDGFGTSVALGGGGEIAVVGSPGHNPCGIGCVGAGKAHVFSCVGATWVPLTGLLPAQVVPLGGVGISVSVAGDGDRVLCGAPVVINPGPSAGQAYVFELTGTDCNENVLCDDREIAEGSATDNNGTGIPDDCEGDLDGDGLIGFIDFQLLLALWGPCPQSPALCPADLSNDGQVGIVDLLTLLLNWS